MGIGLNLKKLLKDKNMTIQELSKISGISANTLYGIVKRDNNTIQPEISDKLSKALNISKDKLMGWDIYKVRMDALVEEGRKHEDFINKMTELENKLLENFNLLNINGMNEAIKRISELSQLEQYKAYYTVPEAAIKLSISEDEVLSKIKDGIIPKDEFSEIILIPADYFY